jgi:hypothetical protein
MPDGWALAVEPIRSAKQNTRRSQEFGLRLGQSGACNSPLYWFQRFMVANVALPLQDLQNGYSSMYLWCAARWPRSEDRRDRRWPPLRVPFLASKKGDCIVHTPSQSWKCCWPTRAEGRSTEVVGNEMQTTKAHVQDSQAKVSACCDLPCSGCARSSASPNRWNHAGARHVILSTLSQRASPSNKPVVF